MNNHLPITKSNVQHIQQLQKEKNYRSTHASFVIEGEKWVNFALDNYPHLVRIIVGTREWYTNNKTVSEEEEITPITYYFIKDIELNRISTQKTPNKVVAVLDIPSTDTTLTPAPKGITLVIDNMNDPGNFGTIIRLSGWFGIQQIVCSEQTVDCYNPKVVQATMGSLLGISITYTDLATYLANTTLPVYAADMKGDTLAQIKFPEACIILIGQESNGLSADLYPHITQRIHIPSAPSTEVESLNVGMAASIICYEFYR